VLQRDRAQLERAQLELKRQTELAGRGSRQRQSSKTRKWPRRLLRRHSRHEAAAENARVNLSYTTITFAHHRAERLVTLKRGNRRQVDDTTTNAVPLVTITQLRPIYVGFTIPERTCRTSGQPWPTRTPSGVVTMPSQPDKPITGTSPSSTTRSTRRPARFPQGNFANDDIRLWPGQFVNVNLTLGIQTNAVVVPSPTIQIGQTAPMSSSSRTTRLSSCDWAHDRTEATDRRRQRARGRRARRGRWQLRLNNGTRVTHCAA